MPTGIPGFDGLLDGGLPRERITLLIGGPGCGKTQFALQTLVNGARIWGEPGIFVAFEERADQVIADAAPMGWNLPALRDRQIYFFDAHLPESVVMGGEFDLVGLLAMIEAKAKSMGAKRIVFDGVDMLLGSLDNLVAERREIFRLADWIRSKGLTGLVTCKTDVDGQMPRQHDAHLPYLADCVITLQQQPSASVLVRRLRVTKCRGIGHSGSEVPFTISNTGVQVASYPAIDPAARASEERISTGVQRLDTMLGGGYFRGSAILISGSPGTAKSTLSACFAASAAARGEQTLYVSFDEGPSEILRNMRSVGIDLEPLVRAGKLAVVPARKGDRSAEEHVSSIATMLATNKVRCLVLDPVSALASAGGKGIGEEACARLISITKSMQITLVMSSLVTDVEGELTAAAVSTIADTWIQVSYLVRAGERNRAITIIKARGTLHSKQVRELVLSNDGIDLADVYLAGGEVLMGTMRWQKEAAELGERQHAAKRLAESQREAELAVAETRARLASLELELRARETTLQSLKTEKTDVQDAFDSRNVQMRRLRAADIVAGKAGRGRNSRPEVA